MADQPKRRRIFVADEDVDDEQDDASQNDRDPADDSIGSNPDELVEDQGSDDEDGEDLMENWMADYAPAPELDFYDPTMLTDEVVEESFEEQMRYRRAADEALDAEYERRRRMEEEAEDNLEGLNEQENAEILADDDDDDDEEEEEEDGGGITTRTLNLEAFECPLREWISEERTRQEIKKRFKKFLMKFYVGIDEVTRHEKRRGPDEPLPPGLKKLPPIYPSKIRSMCATNKASLEVSYSHLAEMQSLMAYWLNDVPRDMLQIFDEVLQTTVLEEFPHYKTIAKELHVRIISFPLSDRLRDLRQTDLNHMIRVVGVVTRRTSVFPQIKAYSYDCVNCDQILGPFRGSDIRFRPSTCSGCQSNGPFKINNQKSEYGNYQKLTLQESPGSVPAGRVPRYKDVILLGDLIDVARPGEEVEVIGIYTAQQINLENLKNAANSFPVFTTYIDAISVQKKNVINNSLTDEDKRRIRELSTDPSIGERIIRSMAPSIYGHRHVKTAIALSLFGGCAKEAGGGGTHRVRGDINVLLLGDPGTAKSQILKYAEKISPRSVYTTGKGASAVGLTAGVRRDPITKDWVLEGGALVLADQGLCLIDEFDKMNEQDRTSIHEAMEQQTISVSKAGIVTSLQARCAVMAAANPISGRYDSSYTLAENVELTDPILQRFDILCVLQDIVDPVIDEQLALFVTNSHIRSHPDNITHTVYESDAEDDNEDDDDNDEKNNRNGQNNNNNNIETNDIRQLSGDGGPEPLDQETLKKYIAYARTFVRPVLHDVDSEKIASLYAELRQQSAISGGVPIAVRHIESVMRMSEASARMHLRDHVREDDVDLAIKVMLESFLQAQKVSVRKMLQRSFRKYITFGEETNHLIMHQLQGLVLNEEKYQKIKLGAVNTEVIVHMDQLEAKVKDLNIYDLSSFYKSTLFKKLGFHIDEHNQVIVKTY